MLRKSEKSSPGKPKGRAALDRPFDAALLAKARDIAAQYRLILEPDADLGFVGHALEMPGVMADGKTPNTCVHEIREMLTTAVATLLELGEKPPAPADAKRRTEQINIRLTNEEKLLLEDVSRRRGYRGLSDFVRAATLASAER